jgi:putative phosphoesterase
MPVSRSGRLTPPSDASFVLRRQATLVRVQQYGVGSEGSVGSEGHGPSARAELPRLQAMSARSAGSRTPPSSGAGAGQKAGVEQKEDQTTNVPSRGDVAPKPASAEEAAQGLSGARIGVISDNHGYLDPAVLEIFAGVTHIIHAGDIMDPDILSALETVAPVTAVAGNMDASGATSELPREVAGEAAGVRFVVGHKRKRLLKRLDAGRIQGSSSDDAPDLVIYGHDHVAAAAWVDDTLFLNPGTASSPDDEDDGPTVAIVSVRPTGLAVCFVPLRRREADETSTRGSRS